MSYLSMKSELAEAIPGMSRIYAGTLVNRAWGVVRDSALWSFQLQQGGFATADLVSAGAVTVQPSPPSNLVVGDATASAAWGVLGWPFITTYQFRVQGYSIYSVVGADFTNPAAVVLYLDRPFIDPVTPTAGAGYQLLTAYVPAPSASFKRWLSVMDQFNSYALDIWTSRRDVNLSDPTRLYTSDPDVIMGIGQDQRGRGMYDAGGNSLASATLGWQLFELWPNPTGANSYATWYVDRGADLAANDDLLPSPITDDVVLEKAKVYAYEWAEARKDVMAAKGSGANYLTLAREAEARFLARLKTLRLDDKDNVDAYNQRLNAARGGVYLNPSYNSVTGRANMGWPR